MNAAPVAAPIPAMQNTSRPRTRNDNFFLKYIPRRLPDAPKYVILREAVVAAIEDGYWKGGDRLPTEVELTRLTPYSLGTVQRAIQGLVADGFVIRRQGSGTFVATGQRRIGGPWLFRFLARDGKQFAPMFTKVIARRKVKGSGAWVRWLTKGESSKEVLEIDRLITANGEFTVFNRHYLDPEKFPIFVSMPIRELDGANFAGLIQETYNLPITHIAHTFECAPFPEAARRALELPRRAHGLIVEISASAGRNRPASYQQLFIPAGATKLFISESFDEWIASIPMAPERKVTDSAL